MGQKLPRATAARVEAVKRLDVPIVVRLGRTRLNIRQVISLAPGAILELGSRPDEPLDLLVENVKVGIGTTVKVGENYGVRVETIGTEAEILSAVEASKADAAQAAGPTDDADALAEALLSGQA